MTGKEWAERAVTEPKEKWPEGTLHIEGKHDGLFVVVPHMAGQERGVLVDVLGGLIAAAVADATKDQAAKLEELQASANTWKGMHATASREREELREKLAAAEKERDRLQDLPQCRRQFPDGNVPGNTEEALVGWMKIADDAIHGKQELIRHNGVIMEQLKAEQKNRDETVAKLAESEKARGIMQTARDNLEQWQKRAEEYALNNGNLRRSCEAKERELVHLRQASGNLTAENTKLRASKAELTKLLNEAGGLLCEHHAYGIMDGIRLGGECPACSKKGTEKYPNNIFGRIDAATKGAATPGVRMWQAAHVNAWDGSMMWFLRDNGEWMDSSHTLASIIDQDNRELSPAEVAAILAEHPLPDHVPDEVRAYSPGDDAKAAAEPPKVRRWKRVDGEFTGGVVYVQCTDGKTCYSVWENGRKVPDSTFDISHTEAYVRDGLWRELTDAENAAIDAPKAAPPADEIPFGKPARTTAEIERDADTLSQHIYVAMRPPTMAERLRLRDFEDEYRAAQAREAKS